ncbi:hypothetical protein AB0D37_08235 [Streptomyces sp. NPDC048384]|uniref:hypothetical protein n=1 Tax=Streptomyces sp. NPDC048384 TaxID=3155487 RepID=UPI0034346056
MTPKPSPERSSGPPPEITTTECRTCGTLVSGVDGRYACGMCGWVNHWSEGHRDLPNAEDDPDWQAH